MDCEDPLTRRIVFLGKALSDRFGRMLASQDCTLPAWAVLRYAHLNPGLSQAQLAGLIGVEGPSLTRQLDKLAAEGLVDRRRDERDRRIVRVTLTEAGEQRFSALRHLADDYDHHLTSVLSDSDIRVVGDAITAMHRLLEDHDVRVNVTSG